MSGLEKGALFNKGTNSPPTLQRDVRTRRLLQSCLIHCSGQTAMGTFSSSSETCREAAAGRKRDSSWCAPCGGRAMPRVCGTRRTKGAGARPRLPAPPQRLPPLPPLLQGELAVPRRPRSPVRAGAETGHPSGRLASVLSRKARRGQAHGAGATPVRQVQWHERGGRIPLLQRVGRGCPLRRLWARAAGGLSAERLIPQVLMGLGQMDSLHSGWFLHDCVPVTCWAASPQGLRGPGWGEHRASH